MKKTGVYLLLIAMLAFLAVPIKVPCAYAQDSLPKDFNLPDVDQVTFYSLSSYRGKQPVLLLFWTTWCHFCQNALKSLTMMYPELQEQGVEVLAINVGESPRKAAHAVRYYKLPFTVLLDRDSRAVRDYNLLGVPTYILLDKEGRIVFQENYLPKRRLRKILKDE
ncbi:MAG: TlpA family protein disulfide reductase [Candidatus Omnitrophica bacterium]|nr:TlpA family protein disulfide reductase [Candidatus Omnitrophota bacterium]